MKKYWKSLEDHKESSEHQNLKKEPQPEFSIEGLSDEEVKGKSSRRDFLKMLGFTVGYASLAAGCEMPVRKAIPFLNNPEEITPGEANYYASTFFSGNDYCSVLVKVREGRPIKIEGNTLSGVTKGGTNARAQASVLNLYDTTRLKNPLKDGNETKWEIIDNEIGNELSSIANINGKAVILSSTVISPSTQSIFREFSEKYPGTEWITYDAVSAAGIRKANEISFGKAIIPDYRFDKADMIVSFNADFLGNWLNSLEYIKAYTANRNLTNENTMSRHIQFESIMSLTGSNADDRYPIKPSDEQTILLNLYNEIAGQLGAQTYAAADSPVDVKALAEELTDNKGRSLVVCGSNNTDTQLIVNAINYLLDNFGNTIDLNTPLNLKQGSDEKMAGLVDSMNNGEISALFVYNCNPAYDYYDKEQFISGIKKVPLAVSFSDIQDETAKLAKYVCPDSNYLESWNDAEPKAGFYSLGQPTISRLFNTRQAQESLLTWMDHEIKEFYPYIQNYWQENIFPNQDRFLSFETFWNQSLHDGVFELAAMQGDQPEYSASPLKAAASKTAGDFELVLYQTPAMGDGKYANNPWLQELPDPISKVTWDNYLNMSPKQAEELGLENESLVSVDGKFELPVLVQAGQPYGVVSIALGYGRTNAGKVGDGVGQNAFGFIKYADGTMRFDQSVISVSGTGQTYPLAMTQTHHLMEGRPIVRETSYKDWKKDPAAGNHLHEEVEKKHVSLYPTPSFPDFHWGLAVNLNTCIGCSACEISCQAENNIAVIGKEEVRKRRIMHWMRIDRYYSDDPENPEVFHQPVMCQQCDNAPCENVCPVAATPHSNEGLNMMAYNRCIGTRYCMNNCPYRVRRFNWFNYINNNEFPYNMDSDLGKMVLNPDVVVRTRGVVEKCSFCSQRIQEKKLEAKKENRMLRDGDIKTACQQACPADAIVFGNLNDKDSEVSKAYANPRNYHLLEEIHTLPSVGYLTKVRNKETKA